METMNTGETIKTGILFDMDGTLWNSTREAAHAWSALTVPRLGKAVTEEDMYRVMGMPMDKLARTLFPDSDEAEVLKIMEESGTAENEYLISHGAVLYPGVVETIKILSQEYPLFIVSNCQTGYIEAFLTYYHLEEYFEDHICFGTNLKSKGENIAIIIQRNGLDRGIYVGDIQADYEAASAGGAEFVYASYGFGEVHAPVPRLDAFFELPRLLKSYLSVSEREV